MKKRIFALVIAVLLVLTLAACGSQTATTVTSGNTQTEEGGYLLFKTRSDVEYLSFLEEFNYEKYEIVNISTVMKHTLGNAQLGESYMVTYKVK